MTKSSNASVAETAPAPARRARKSTGRITLSDLARLVGGATVSGLLERVKANVLEAQAHQD
ncbi:GntR family transcriptional regulator, partial [Ralstonia pseudosolanacearum]